MKRRNELTQAYDGNRRNRRAKNEYSFVLYKRILGFISKCTK